MSKTDFNSNFQQSVPATQARPFDFTSSIRAAARKDGNDFDMPAIRLSESDNKNFAATMASIGLGKIDDKDLFFYGEPSEKYVAAVGQSKSAQDQSLASAFYSAQIPAFVTIKTGFDQKVRTFIGPKHVKYTADNFGFSQDIVLRATATHELTHKTAYDFFPVEQSDKAELVADYVSAETTDPLFRLLRNITTRQSVGGFTADHYDLAKECAYQAFQQTVEAIDPKIGKSLASGSIENPLMQTDAQAKAGFDPNAGENIKIFYNNNLDAFYKKYVAKIDGAPPSAQFGRLVLAAFMQNMKAKALELVAARKVELAGKKPV